MKKKIRIIGKNDSYPYKTRSAVFSAKFGDQNFLKIFKTDRFFALLSNRLRPMIKQLRFITAIKVQCVFNFLFQYSVFFYCNIQSFRMKRSGRRNPPCDNLNCTLFSPWIADLSHRILPKQKIKLSLQIISLILFCWKLRSRMEITIKNIQWMT